MFYDLHIAISMLMQLHQYTLFPIIWYRFDVKIPAQREFSARQLPLRGQLFLSVQLQDFFALLVSTLAIDLLCEITIDKKGRVKPHNISEGCELVGKFGNVNLCNSKCMLPKTDIT